MTEFFVVEPCTTSNGVEVKLNKKINLAKTEKILGSVGSSPVVILSKFKKYNLSIYSSGRIMIKGSKKISTKAGSSIAKELIALLEKENALTD